VDIYLQRKSYSAARIEAQVGGQVLERQVTPTRGYLSQVELPITLGLGRATKIDRLTVYWPDGSSQQVEAGAIDRQLTVEQAVR